VRPQAQENYRSGNHHGPDRQQRYQGDRHS
jgi:hypothetical protein